MSGNTKSGGDTRAVEREFRDKALLNELAQTLPPVFSRIDSAWAEAENSATDLVTHSEELSQARSLAASYRDVDKAYREAVAIINNDRRLSEEGKLLARKDASDLRA